MENTQITPAAGSTILEILDRTFRIYRNNFVQYVALAAGVTFPLAIINLLLSQQYFNLMQNFELSFNQRSAAASNYSFLILGVAIIINLIQAVLVTGTITYMASENHLGRQVTVAEAFQAIRGRYLTLLGALIVFYLIVGALTFASALTLVCLVGIAGFGFLIYLGVNMSVFLAPTIILENVGGMQGLNRGWSLAKTRFWSILGLVAIIAILSAVITFAFTLLEQLLTTQIIASASAPTAMLVSGIVSAIIGIFIVPISPIALTLMYYDTRVRLEALDIALQAMGKPDARPSDVISPPASASLTSKDFVNILILVVGGAVIILGIGASMSALVNVLFPNLPLR